MSEDKKDPFTSKNGGIRGSAIHRNLKHNGQPRIITYTEPTEEGWVEVQMVESLDPNDGADQVRTGPVLMAPLTQADVDLAVQMGLETTRLRRQVKESKATVLTLREQLLKAKDRLATNPNHSRGTGDYYDRRIDEAAQLVEGSLDTIEALDLILGGAK